MLALYAFSILIAFLFGKERKIRKEKKSGAGPAG
jgi:hypothetical protein